MGDEASKRILLLDEPDIYRYLIDEAKKRFGCEIDSIESIDRAYIAQDLKF